MFQSGGKKMKKSPLASLAAIASAILLLASCAGSAKPMPSALELSPSASSIQDRGSYIAFLPKAPKELGFIFYPGAKVEPRAYAPLLSSLADSGYLVLMPRMPFDLAIFDTGKAAGLMKRYPEVKRWTIGGHSLGGVAAAIFAKKKPAGLVGIAFFASFPDNGSDLSASGLSVLSISGSRDGLSTSAKIEFAKRLLPPDTQFRVIEGGNHAQFGWYGPQKGDNEASISRESQQAQIKEAILTWLGSFLP
jgi:pimeloyl-ACP methyl ester carboxylesterase